MSTACLIAVVECRQWLNAGGATTAYAMVDADKCVTVIGVLVLKLMHVYWCYQ
jgi:hypothetical protein